MPQSYLTHTIGNFKGSLKKSDAYNPLTIGDTDTPDSQNFFVTEGELRKVKGYQKFYPSALNGEVMFIDNFFKTDGSSWLMAATTRECYKYASSVFTPITDTPFTGGTNDQFWSEIMNDKYIICNGIDHPRVWTGSGNIANLGGLSGYSSFTAKTGRQDEAHKYFLMGYTIEDGLSYPARVKLSDYNNPESYVDHSPIDLSGPDWIVNIEFLNNKPYVIRERSIWVLNYYGAYISDAYIVYVPDQVQGAVGILAGATASILGDELIYLGADGLLYAFDGIRSSPVSDDINKLLFDDLNPLYRYLAHGIIIEELNEYRMHYISKNSSVFDKVLRWNYYNKTYDVESNAKRCAGYYYREADYTWDDMDETWDSIDWAWDDRFQMENNPTTFVGDDNGCIYEIEYGDNFDGAAIDGWWTSKLYTLPLEEEDSTLFKKRVLRVDVLVVNNGTYTIAVSVGADEKDNWQQTVNLTLDGSGKWKWMPLSFDVWGVHHQIKFAQSDADAPVKIRAFRFRYVKETSL